MASSGVHAIVLAAALTLLGGCATSRGGASAQAIDPLQARGEVPGWTLTVTPARIVFASEDGTTLVNEANAKGTVPREGRIAGRRISVETSLQPCALTAGAFAQTVRVTVDGRAYSGCGGNQSREVPLASGPWTVLAVNGRPTPLNRPFDVRFEGRVMSLRLGCEPLSAPYVLAGQVLSAGALSTSPAVCADPSYEEAARRTLALPLAVEAIGSEQLILRNALGTLSLARERR